MTPTRAVTVVPASPGWSLADERDVPLASKVDDLRFRPVVAWAVHVETDKGAYPIHRFADPVSVEGRTPDNFILRSPEGQCWWTHGGPLSLTDAFEAVKADLADDDSETSPASDGSSENEVEDTSYSAYDVTFSLHTDFLWSLPEGQRTTIARLMARAAERSYRRGFQQGATIARDRPQDLPQDLHDWRYGTSTDLSPWADTAYVESSLDRLHTENRNLRLAALDTRADTDPI